MAPLQMETVDLINMQEFPCKVVQLENAETRVLTSIEKLSNLVCSASCAVMAQSSFVTNTHPVHPVLFSKRNPPSVWNSNREISLRGICSVFLRPCPNPAGVYTVSLPANKTLRRLLHWLKVQPFVSL